MSRKYLNSVSFKYSEYFPTLHIYTYIHIYTEIITWFFIAYSDVVGAFNNSLIGYWWRIVGCSILGYKEKNRCNASWSRQLHV